MAHFRITDLNNADIIIAQPPNYSDPNALSTGYCAFHDYTCRLPGGITTAYARASPTRTCPTSWRSTPAAPTSAARTPSTAAPAGKLDGFSIVLGHEIEETVTDPGAEDILGNITSTQHATRRLV